jgi:hypothetical protein
MTRAAPDRPWLPAPVAERIRESSPQAPTDSG